MLDQAVDQAEEVLRRRRNVLHGKIFFDSHRCARKWRSSTHYVDVYVATLVLSAIGCLSRCGVMNSCW